MKPSFIKLSLSISTVFLLAACGGDNNNTHKTSPGTGGAETPEKIIQLKADELIGQWNTSAAQFPSYDFYSSATEAPFNTEVKAGRMLEKGNLSSLFYWEIQATGQISIKAVGADCFQRPINLCPVQSTQTITIKNDDAQRPYWTIVTDKNADGVIDSTAKVSYSRQTLNLAPLTAGDIYLSHDDNSIFDTPVVGKIANQQLSIRLDDLAQAVTLTSDSFTQGAQRINFSTAKTSLVSGTQEFAVEGLGNKVLPVTTWYDKVALLARQDKQYVLEYEIHRKVQIPADIKPETVALNDIEKVEKKSFPVSLINTFDKGVAIQPLTHYFISLEVGFLSANAGNDLYFSSATEGTLSVTNPHEDTPKEAYPFTWKQDEDGTLHLKFAERGDVALKFIQKIDGGYQAIYNLPNPHGDTYRIRDFILDGVVNVDEKSTPGFYTFPSISPLPNGSHQYFLTLHEDKSITGLVGGYWFLDTKGDIVSYECITLAGQKPTSYEECKSGLEHLDQYAFIHIRRLHFVYQNGNHYQAKYSGAIYQYMPGNNNPAYYTFGLTYRWTKASN